MFVGLSNFPTDLVQMADTVDNMLADMSTLGAEPYKIHRIYRRSI
jgi:hypothetical protein